MDTKVLVDRPCIQVRDYLNSKELRMVRQKSLEDSPITMGEDFSRINRRTAFRKYIKLSSVWILENIYRYNVSIGCHLMNFEPVREKTVDVFGSTSQERINFGALTVRTS